MHELVEYFTDIDKRLAWEGQTYDTIEEVKSYPMNTSLFYMKFKKAWSEGQKDMLLLTHGVELRGNRYYLTSNSVQHKKFPDQKKTTRVECKISSQYFEPMADGTGVKSFTIMHSNPKNNTTMKD